MSNYQCSVCCGRVMRQYPLYAHMLIHTKDRSYKCNRKGCGKTFNAKSNLNRHTKVHLKKNQPKNQLSTFEHFFYDSFYHLSLDF